MDATSAPKVTVVQPGEGESVSIPGFGAVYKLYSRDNGGEVAIVEHPFAVGYLTAPHWHTREDEHSIVVEGEIGFRSDDAEVVLGPGGYITKPRGQMHAMWNAGTVPGRIIEVITPGGFESYFRELGELLTARLVNRRRQMMAHARRRNASWMSSRISQRMRVRRNQCNRANVCSTTQRYRPSPEPCPVPRRAMTGVTPTARTCLRYLSWS
jgi:mannose-6-phosphate isomerase-like protein (cupin superfamily)